MIQLTDNTSRYLYETHLHTKEGSACAVDSGMEMARAYKSAGYHGIIVTNHFFNGNTTISRRLPWNDRVELFMRGYESAKREGDRIGLSVFFGWEYGDGRCDFLTYGLDKHFLLAHPEMMNWSLEQYVTEVHNNGGFITHAHPFREAFYIDRIRLYPNLVDAVEVYNASHKNPSYNRKALAYAMENRLIPISGSDSHAMYPILGGGIVSNQRLDSIEDFIQLVRSRRGYQLLGQIED